MHALPRAAALAQLNTSLAHFTCFRLAYDGKGNAVVSSEADIDAAVASLGGYEQGLYAEKWCPFVKELAVMVVRR